MRAQNDKEDMQEHVNILGKQAQDIESKSIDENTKKDNEISEKEPSNHADTGGKTRSIVQGANALSLGISMVVAVLIGLGIGYGLYKLLGYYWLIWVGLFYGVAAAFLNVFKAYKRLNKDLDSLRNEEKYKYMQDRILEQREQREKN